MNRISLLLFALNVLLFSSCTIQKRLHRPGYTISSNLSLPSWKKKVNTPVDLDQNESVKKAEPNLTASSDNQNDIAFIQPSNAQESELILDVNPKDTLKPPTCDEIFLSTGEIIKGERLVQLNQKVYYTPCGSESTERPFVLEKFVLYIRYADGKYVTVNRDPAYPTVLNSGESNSLNRTKSGLAITSIILASIGLPGLILFGYGGILGFIGLLFGIAAGAKKGGVVEKRTRRLVVWGIVLSLIVLLLGLLILTMWL